VPEFHRRSLRLRNFDYSQTGAYLVTICVQHRACLFGCVAQDERRPNTAGEMIHFWWDRLPSKFSSVSCDAVIVMPNHVQSVLLLWHGPPEQDQSDMLVTLGGVVQWFKTMTTTAYMQKVRSEDCPTFNGRLWQRNYSEHIIRNDRDLERIRDYMDANPSRWAMEAENPESQHTQGQTHVSAQGNRHTGAAPGSTPTRYALPKRVPHWRRIGGRPVCLPQYGGC